MKKLTIALFAVVAVALLAGQAGAAVIDIDGRLADSTESSALEWSVPADTENDGIKKGDPIPDTAVSDTDVTLTASTNGQVWNDAWSAGSYTEGAEWNFRAERGFDEDPEFGVASQTESVNGGYYIEMTLDSTGHDSDPFDLNSISVSLWRNGDGAPSDFGLAFDGDDNGWDTGDFLTDASVGSGIDNATTLTASDIDSSATTSIVRLYYWGTDNNSGNTHLYDVSADYTVIPEPASLGLFGIVCGALWFARRKFRGMAS